MHVIRRLSLSLAIPAMLVLSTATTHAASGPKPQPALIRITHDARLGQILITAQRRTLYHFSLDRNGKIGCTGACLKFWFPLVVAKGTATAAVAPGIGKGIGVITRGAGRWQVTYKGHPLYTFIGDQKAGQTTGQGYKDFGGVWTVATVGATRNQWSNAGSGGYPGY